MEVSILQHAKDTSPQTVTMGQVVELIGRTDWPPGYQPQLLVQGTFEGGVRQEDITRLSGLSAAVFCRVDDSRMAELREEARADPHTLLLFTAADTLTIVYPYELDTGYEVHLQRQFYQKAFLYGNDYYEQLLGVESVRKGRDAGRRIALVHDGEAYYNPQAGVGDNPKDEELALTQYGLISCEELDTMTAREMNGMKRAVTLQYVNVRPPFGRYTVHRPHIASFCGTGNNEKFLNDPTGSRRWLAFKVESILSPLDCPFEYAGIYAQALYLYRHGFQYWFSGDETAAVDARNRRFQVANLERQLVYRYYRRPAGADEGDVVSVAGAMQHIGGNMTAKLRKERVEQAFIDLGFEPVECDGLTGYLAVQRAPEEVSMLGRQLATRARRDQEPPDHF